MDRWIKQTQCLTLGYKQYSSKEVLNYYLY